MTHYLAIDIGTESARAAVYTDLGTKVGDGHGRYPTTFPRPGWAEQDPALWWLGAVAAAREALGQAGVDDVAGVSVATTSSSVVVLDEHGRPLRPALLWMDSRASAEAEATAASRHPALQFSGGSDSSEWLVPKAMWLAANERELYLRARYIGESVDYMTLRLTGEWVGSRLNATCKWNYDERSGDLPHDLYAELGVPELGGKLPSVIRGVGEAVGPLSADAAAELGLVGRPVVATGGIDAHLSLIPLASVVRDPVSIVAGTSNAFIAQTDSPAFSPEIWGPYPHALTAGRWLVEGGQVSAGSALTWLSETVLGCSRDDLPGLIETSRQVPAVEHGVLVLDNFMGNRTPLRDPRQRGAVLGLTLGTTPAVLYRAAVESVAYGTRQVLESFARAGVDTSSVVLSGGIRHNPFWLEITTDVLGRPVSLAGEENLTLLACAAAAAAGANGTSIESEAAAFRPALRTVEPTAAAPSYGDGYEAYLEAVTATTPTSHRLVDLSSGRVATA